MKELITIEKDSIMSLIEIAEEAAKVADDVSYYEFNNDSEEFYNKIIKWKIDNDI